MFTSTETLNGAGLSGQDATLPEYRQNPVSLPAECNPRENSVTFGQLLRKRSEGNFSFVGYVDGEYLDIAQFVVPTRSVGTTFAISMGLATGAAHALLGGSPRGCTSWDDAVTVSAITRSGGAGKRSPAGPDDTTGYEISAELACNRVSGVSAHEQQRAAVRVFPANRNEAISLGTLAAQSLERTRDPWATVQDIVRRAENLGISVEPI